MKKLIKTKMENQGQIKENTYAKTKENKIKINRK